MFHQASWPFAGQFCCLLVTSDLSPTTSQPKQEKESESAEDQVLPLLCAARALELTCRTSKPPRRHVWGVTLHVPCPPTPQLLHYTLPSTLLHYAAARTNFSKPLSPTPFSSQPILILSSLCWATVSLPLGQWQEAVARQWRGRPETLAPGAMEGCSSQVRAQLNVSWSACSLHASN